MRTRPRSAKVEDAERQVIETATRLAMEQPARRLDCWRIFTTGHSGGKMNKTTGWLIRISTVRLVIR
ncbi:MAG TPA: hypothetical protein VIT23_01795, partial [Terrimicrobiaceae bacterium]